MSDPSKTERTNPSATSDEQALSSAQGTVQRCEKVVSRALAMVMGGAALFFALAGGAAIATERAAPWWALSFPFVIALLFAATALIKPVLRTTVTDEEVYALHGLREWRVVMCSIDSVKVVDGVRPQLAHAELIGPAVTSRVVLIEWTDSNGQAKKSAIASNDPEALAASINAVRESRATRLSSVRVFADVHEGDADAVEVEASRASAARDESREG